MQHPDDDAGQFGRRHAQGQHAQQGFGGVLARMVLKKSRFCAACWHIARTSGASIRSRTSTTSGSLRSRRCRTSTRDGPPSWYTVTGMFSISS